MIVRSSVIRSRRSPYHITQMASRTCSKFITLRELRKTMSFSSTVFRRYSTVRFAVRPFSAVRSPQSLLSSVLRHHSDRSFTARPFSALMSPPSTAVVYEEEGPPDDVTKIVELPAVEIKENDVCVKMLAAPINPSDINRIQGVYPIRPELPAVGGYEGVGEVHSVGSAVTSLSPGDWVIPFPPCSGTWQTYMVKDQSVWHKVDNTTPLEYAATVSVNPLTALRMLEDFVNLKPGESIIQNGATSIVGQCIIQLARLRGVKTINIVRDRLRADEAKEKLLKLGADAAYTEAELAAKKMKHILAKFPETALGFNCVGGDSASLILKYLREGGTMVTYGGMSKKPWTVSTSPFIFQDISLRGFWLQKLLTADKADECKKMVDYLLGLTREGKLKYETQTIHYPFSRFRAFHVALDKSLGKLGSQPKQILKFQPEVEDI